VVLVEIELTNYSRKWRNERNDENTTPPVSNQNKK
jgi:hypothetical protein